MLTHLLKNIFWGSAQKSVWIRLLVIAIIALIARITWLTVRNKIVYSPAYIITEKDIEIEKTPEWIPADFSREVFHAWKHFEKEDFNLLDPTIADKLARAFELHSWVEEVEQVTLNYPTHVKMKIRFRQPMALIRTDGNAVAGTGFLIDANAVLLPTTYFHKRQDLLQKYLWVEGINTPPIITADGETWGDPNVAEVALLASFLERDKERFGLDKIEVVISKEIRDLNTYNIYTKSGIKIIWGHFPLPGNMDGEKNSLDRERMERLKKDLFERQSPKLERLRTLLGTYKTFDNIPKKESSINVADEELNERR